MTRGIVLILALLLTACDFIYGVSRSAQVSHVPNMDRLKARIESYPEIDKVELERSEGGRPVTFTGIKSRSQLQYLHYSGEDVFGSLLFSKDYRGRVTYSQSLIRINVRPPQSTIDATWPVMLRVEKDLESEFGLKNLGNESSTAVTGVTLPGGQGR